MRKPKHDKGLRYETGCKCRECGERGLEAEMRGDAFLGKTEAVQLQERRKAFDGQEEADRRARCMN